MSKSQTEHQHLGEEQVDEAARAALDGREASRGGDQCAECAERVAAQERYLTLARLLTRDTRPPAGAPSADAVRTIRRRSYRSRALREIGTLVASVPLKARS